MPKIATPLPPLSRSRSEWLAKEARRIGNEEASLSRESLLLRRQSRGALGVLNPTRNQNGRPVNLADELPEEYLLDRSYRLYILQNLAWDYVNTILDICAQQKIHDTKPLVRTIHYLRRNYDIFRARCIDEDHVENETRDALRFEEEVASDLRKFHNAVYLDSSRIDLSANARTLIFAVQDAMLILDAIKEYARSIDREIAAMGIWTCDCCLVNTEVMKLWDLIPQFGGDCYKETSSSRALSVKIILNRLRAIPVKIQKHDQQ